MKSLSVLLIGTPSCFNLAASAQAPGTRADPHVLTPSPETVVWGYYWSETPPVLHVRSGDVVRVHTLVTSNPAEPKKSGFQPTRLSRN